MGKEKFLTRWIGGFAIVIAVSAFAIAAQCLEKVSNESDGVRADVIAIDTMAASGRLERPAVAFPHDLHTEALDKKGKACETCHVKVEGRLSARFKGTEEKGRKATMEGYHDNCIACHKEATAAKEKSGPVTCAACHAEAPAYVAKRSSAGFDNSLHARHVQAEDKKCEACHHDYNEKTKKLAYEKGKEGTCRYCHKDGAAEYKGVMTSAIKDAAHASCIACHQEKVAKKKDAGPVKCAGCHDAALRGKIKRLSPVPRMERKQPDATLVTIGSDKKEDLRMAQVPFDHKAHEGYNQDCRTCHHAAMTACSECHTLKGDKKGKGVTLEKAMHTLESRQSCFGCHETKKKAKECAGCHDLMGRVEKRDDASCASCHIKAETTDAKEPAEKAKALLTKRDMTGGTIADKEIPEKVVIQSLSKKYQKVEFPHRQVVLALASGVAKKPMAAGFHMDKMTLCQGCHHNSPVSATPPSCGSCHAKPFDDKHLDRPGLVGAYHLQCMGCHEKMGIEKPMGCTECHLEKK